MQRAKKGLIVVYDIYAKRQSELRKQGGDVYEYDKIPQKLIVQIIYLFEESFSCAEHMENRRVEIFQSVAKIMREELGVFKLAEARTRGVYGDIGWNYEKEVKSYLQREEDVELVLSVVELFFRIVYFTLKKDFSYTSWEDKFEHLIHRLNIRFRENGIGYSLENNTIIRKDSELIHETIVKPALALLHKNDFKNAEDEYLAAHKHYREGNYEDCHVDCLRALETTIKIIAHQRKWKDVKDSDSIGQLIEHVVRNELLPNFMLQQFTSLRSCLQSGVPTIRNKKGGHGKGVDSAPIPAYLPEFLLGQTATCIRLLVNAHHTESA